MSRQLKRDSLVGKTLASLARTGGNIKARPIARPRTEEPDTATATKRAIEEFKIGEAWKQARLAAERWHEARWQRSA